MEPAKLPGIHEGWLHSAKRDQLPAESHGVVSGQGCPSKEAVV